MLKEFTHFIKELSYEKRQVTLASGRVSDFYIDFGKYSAPPQGEFFYELVNRAEKIKKKILKLEVWVGCCGS